MSCTVLFAQGSGNKYCFDSVEVQQIRKDYAKLEYLEHNDSLNNIIQDSMQSRLETRANRIKNLEIDLSKANEQLILYKQSEAQVKLSPLIEWQGCYINFVPYYRIDSAIMTETFISHFRYALSVDANISIMQKFRLAGELEFNFSDKPVIKLKAGYRIF